MATKKQLPQLSGGRVPQKAVDKAAALTKQVRTRGHPRATQGDVIAALLLAATPKSAAAALTAYVPILGEALEAIDPSPPENG